MRSVRGPLALYEVIWNYEWAVREYEEITIHGPPEIINYHVRKYNHGIIRITAFHSITPPHTRMALSQNKSPA